MSFVLNPAIDRMLLISEFPGLEVLEGSQSFAIQRIAQFPGTEAFGSEHKEDF
jgi:hypothetical protein